MKKLTTILLLFALCLSLCTALASCTDKDPEQEENGSLFDQLTLQDSFEDGKPYHLYFVSNGDGTCTLRYLSVNPESDADFVIEIPENSPAGDVVTAIDLQLKNGALDHARPANFPTVVTAGDYDAICNKMLENGASDFLLGKFQAYYYERFADQKEGEKLETMLLETPFAALGNVYVFAPKATEDEAMIVMQILESYAAWDGAAYDACRDNLLELAKQSESLEQAEACLSGVRYGSTEHVTGLSIPGTVSSMGQDMYQYLPNFKQVSVAEDSEYYTLLDNCLIETQTHTLKLCLNGGTIPADAGIEVLDSYALMHAEYLLGENGGREGIHAYIPDGVTTLNKNWLAGIVVENPSVFTIHLPASLKTFSLPEEVWVYQYPGTRGDLELDVTFTDVAKDSYIYIRTDDKDYSQKFTPPKTK